MMGKGEDDGLWTVECLRGRLLAERVASKAAKAEAELMAKRVAELERQLIEELKRMKRAEKRMRSALKKLESMKLSESSSSSSSVDSGQCGSGKGVGELQGHLGSEDFTGDDGSGDSSADSLLQVVSHEGSCSSLGTGHSCSEKATRRDEANKGLLRQSSVSGNKVVSMKHQTELVGDALAPVAKSLRSSPEAYRLEINNNVHGVLVSLRYVRGQLQDSKGRRASAYSSKELCGW